MKNPIFREKVHEKPIYSWRIAKGDLNSLQV